MKEDLSKNYSIGRWYHSLGEKKRSLPLLLILPLVAGLSLVGFDWFQSTFGTRGILKEAVPMDASFYETTETKVEVKAMNGRQVVILTKNSNYMKSFLTGAIIAFCATLPSAVIALSREPDGSGQ